MKTRATTEKERNGSSNSLINPPPRCSPAGTAVVLMTVAALSLSAVLPAALGKWTLAALFVLTPLALLSRVPYAVHMAFFTLIWDLLIEFVPAIGFWPFDKLVPIAVYGLVVSAVAPLRHSIGWLHPGRFGPGARRAAVGIAFVSAAALIAWVLLLEPDLYYHLRWIPLMPLWAFPLAAVGFAVANAAMEEIIFRGIMMEALDSALGAGLGSIGVQAASFAAFHYLAGFPNGVIGFLMVLVYGLMLGALRRRSRGLLAPWAAHAVADLVIFIILAFVLLQHQGSRMV